MNSCVCGSEIAHEACCGRFIEGGELPATPEELMRSRYNAYAQANIDYIVDTMQGKAAEGFDAPDAKAWASSVKWIGLKVIKAWQDSPSVGYVDFVAKYKENGKAEKIAEQSEFHLIDGKWFYIGEKEI